MIDEKKLIEDLKESGMIVDNDYGNAMVDFIESQPKSDWIPCSERLPENISTVIVQVKEIEKPTFGWYGSISGWRLIEIDFVELKGFTVIAWQPLPQPYKKEGAE